jgi:serine/threonine protein phosphatase 1
MSRSAKVALPRPPASRRFYAIGDVHGRLDLLRRLLALIRTDYLERAGSAPELVFLGDYVDRGPDSAGVIGCLVALAEQASATAAPAPVFLMGNHEALMLDFLADGPRSAAWVHNGGDATLASYGVGLAALGRAELSRARAELTAALPDAHRRFLAGLAPYHRADPYLFVHAGLRPFVPLAQQDAEDLLWIRTPFLEAMGGIDHFVVHGHTIAATPELRPHRLGIDTGAFATGCLTAAVIEAAGLRFLDTGSRADHGCDGAIPGLR